MKLERTAIKFAQTPGVAYQVWTSIRLASVFSMSLILAACGDSPSVEGNATPTGNSTTLGISYLGEAPLTDEVATFKTEFWNKLAGDDKCGQCHTNGGAASGFAFVDLDNINTAFARAIATNNSGQLIVDRSAPNLSRVVVKVAEGHQCWESNPQVCATIIEGYIDNWVSDLDGGSTTGRKIQLTAPTIVDPGNSRNFPDNATDNGANSFANTVHPILTLNCDSCHSETTANPQPPFFANADAVSAYEAAKSKMNLDAPENSRFVSRLKELHNCWTSNCASDANDIEVAIAQFANAIALDVLDVNFVNSKAITFSNAILASGGSRYEDDQIALWEFKTGENSVAYDTSGVEPAMNLNLTNTSWIPGYGIDISAGGRASASTASSKKLTDYIKLTGAYSIEAWVIPGNVTQENARIVSLSGTPDDRNFALSQTMYNYEFMNRSTNTDSGGEPSLMTDANDEDLQSTLQHVVVTFDPVQGRKVYVNSVFTDDSDTPSAQGGNLTDWSDNYSFVLGNEFTGDMGANEWIGKLRLVAIHNSALNQSQISQNYELGVGQKYFMLFSVEHIINKDIPDDGDASNNAYIYFEVEQYDGTGYLFNQPKFISLDDQFTPTTSIPVKGMRIGVNGREVVSGQVYGNVDTSINSTSYTADGQLLSSLGTVIAVEKGSSSDEFFLTFELLGTEDNVRVEGEPISPTAPADIEAAANIGTKTFDEINHTMSVVTGIATTNTAVETLYTTYKQQFPTVENISAFLPSHQMAIAQLAMTYCDQLVTQDIALNNASAQYFSGFNFGATAASAFSSASQDQILEPLLERLANLDASTQTNNLSDIPDYTEIKDALGSPNAQTLDTGTRTINYTSLVATMQTNCTSCNTTARTKEIVTAMCAATLGSSLAIIQ